MRRDTTTTDGSNLFIGKHHNGVLPGIPTPDHRENPDVEVLTHPKFIPDNRPKMVKPREQVLVPRYSHLYGVDNVQESWRYRVDASASGTFTSTPGSTVANTVTLRTVPNWRLSQWPGAVAFYLVIRQFNFCPISSVQLPQNANVPATAGSVTLFTGPGTLTSIVVTTVGATNLTFQDGAGNVIAVVPSTAVVGTVITGNFGFTTSLVANKSATTPVVTAFFTPAYVATGILGILFQDVQGNIIPLGEFSSAGPINTFYSGLILPSPITDVSNPIVGTLQATLDVGAPADSYNWQMGFSAAYLIPQVQMYEHLEKGHHAGNSFDYTE